MIKHILAIIGLIVVILAVLGSMGVGNFRLYYGKEPMKCESTSKA